MKKCSVIVDGMVNLDLKIPFSKSFKAQFEITLNDLTHHQVPDSFICYLRFLGIDEQQIKLANRAYFEAYQQLAHQTFKSYGRCNLVRIENGKLVDFTAGIPEKVAEAYLMQMATLFSNIIVTRGYRSTICFDEVISYEGVLPHQAHGTKVADVIDMAPEKINEIMKTSLQYFQAQNLPYCLWPYKVSTNQTKFMQCNSKITFIGAVDALVGVSMDLHMVTICKSDMTGDIDTNLKLKRKLTLKALKESDHVILHLNGADEAAHRGDVFQKSHYLRNVEDEVLKDLVSYCQSNDIQLDIVVDHICDVNTKKHHPGAVPWMRLKKGEQNEKSN